MLYVYCFNQPFPFCSGEVICDILNNSTIEGAIGGLRVNHILYADALCTISLSSAGLQPGVDLGWWGP